MIDRTCPYYDGDEDCDKCVKNGYIFSCPANCPERFDDEQEVQSMNEWVFTFGCGHELEGKCVRIKGMFGDAREEMCERFGDKWAFQYSADEWEKMKNDPHRRWPMEEEVELSELS